MRHRISRPISIAAIAVIAALSASSAARAADASALIKAAFDNWRANTSETTVEMTIHRPAWERHLTMKGWTEGEDKALVRFTAPAKDAGNATLKLGNQTWIFNPKLNQVVKLPASMMAQSWMGSDFSYNDLSKAEDLLTEYTHKIVGTAQSGGHTVYTIDATPKPGAPVVWGKQQAKVRDDGVFLEETFFDQDFKPVRTMTTDKVGTIGGRVYPLVLTMTPAANPGQWTRITTTDATFNQSLPGYLFTLSNLQNPRD
ncbi:MAG TPA: outer membrane lipoprotein-sorting protein [Devosiaceae bacterium]